jgi:hypothetical protein
VGGVYVFWRLLSTTEYGLHNFEMTVECTYYFTLWKVLIIVKIYLFKNCYIQLVKIYEWNTSSQNVSFSGTIYKDNLML